LINAYADQLQRAPEVVNRLVNDAVNETRDQVLAEFRVEPGPVVYSRNGKLDWESDRQRRAYFASNGFGRGIPYQRRTAPNRLVDRWRVIVVYEANAITSIIVDNPSPIEQFVTGLRQQRFHAITGWYRTEEVMDRADRRLTDSVETAIIRSFYAVEER
jgi:hypothetical protein